MYNGCDFSAKEKGYTVQITQFDVWWSLTVHNNKERYESYCRVDTVSALITALMLFGAVELGLKIKKNEKIVDSD